MASDFNDDSHELSGVLMLAVAQIVSEPIDEVEQARFLRVIHSFSHTSRSIPEPRRWRLIAAAAASLLVGWFAWNSFSRPGWADVVASVAGRPWLRALGKAATGEAVEFWYSPTRQLVASKNGKQVLYFDGQAAVLETYVADGRQPSIHRSALGEESRSRLAEDGGLLQALLADDVETALAGWGAKLIDQQRREINVEGHPRHEYRFVIAGRENPGTRREISVLVDPATKLPTTWNEATFDADEKEILGVQCVLDFPDAGPTSIHALGVPMTAPLVDTVPRGDLQRVLKGLALGRTHFDDYRGLTIWGSADPIPHGGRGPELVYQVWRRGPTWRIESVQCGRREAMPADANPATWWNRQLADSRLILQRLSTGADYYEMTLVPSQPFAPDPDFPDYLKIARFEKRVRSIGTPSDPLRSHAELEMPECLGYPTLLGEGNASYAMTVDTRPAHGPPGCVLIESLGVTSGRDATTGERVWVDPTRGYLVLRRETITGAADDPGVSSALEVTDMAQSPSGRWYPTRLHVIGAAVQRETGEKRDYYVNYYLDFDAAFPVGLFAVPK